MAVLRRDSDHKIRELNQVISNEKEKFECPLCMDAAVAAVLTTCWHLFCDSCLRLNMSAVCPLCNVANVNDNPAQLWKPVYQG